MSIVFGPPATAQVDQPSISEFRDLPVAIIGDEINRSSIMHGGLKPLGPARFVGPALTVECMVGDNSALHYALAELVPGQVIVADARGHIDTAVWGEIMHSCAKARGAAAIVIDGAVRDSVYITGSGLPAFVRGVCPRGPHKGWGGAINRTIQCGGVAVSPGDLVIGDDDGVIVIAPHLLEGLAERCRARIAREAEILRRVGTGEPTIAVLDMPPFEQIGR